MNTQELTEKRDSLKKEIESINAQLLSLIEEEAENEWISLTDALIELGFKNQDGIYTKNYFDGKLFVNNEYRVGFCDEYGYELSIADFNFAEEILNYVKKFKVEKVKITARLESFDYVINGEKISKDYFENVVDIYDCIRDFNIEVID